MSFAADIYDDFEYEDDRNIYWVVNDNQSSMAEQYVVCTKRRTSFAELLLTVNSVLSRGKDHYNNISTLMYTRGGDGKKQLRNVTIYDNGSTDLALKYAGASTYDVGKGIVARTHKEYS